ncbi:MAG: DNA mismatch repair protein MutS, partial [Rhodobacter sp.]|nr:DNA mismatch repair protein MutS [Rhodobacter sp.]
MSRKGPRGLTPEEQSLWNKVKERTAPLHPDRPRSGKLPILQSRPPKYEPAPIPAFRIGEKLTDTAQPHRLQPSLSENLAAQPLRMDRKDHTRLRRGKMKPEARIDLHGMTLADAHPALNRFVADSFAKGRRL